VRSVSSPPSTDGAGAAASETAAAGRVHRRKSGRPRARRRTAQQESSGRANCADRADRDDAGAEVDSGEHSLGRAPFRIVLRFAKPSAEHAGGGGALADGAASRPQSPFLLFPNLGQPFGEIGFPNDDGAAGAEDGDGDGAAERMGADGAEAAEGGAPFGSFISALLSSMIAQRRTPPLERPYPPPPPAETAEAAAEPASAAAAATAPAAARTVSRAAQIARTKRASSYAASLTREEKVYFNQLAEEARVSIMDREDALLATKAETQRTPMRFKILTSDMSDAVKLIVLSKLEHFQGMREGMGEYFKYSAWLNAVARLPLGRYHPLPVAAGSDGVGKIAKYLQGVRATLDATVYGHAEAKDQIMRILAQWVSKPGSRGNCIGIQGPPGCGKTQLIKHGLCKALGLPFGFVALGGASDGSFLEGHGFTYEGSTYGKIAEVLMKAQVMNPVLFFDELDKVSQTQRGEEVVGILTHLTDATQNERFNDRYFAEIDLNLSKCLTVFTYNDPAQVNPILKDRMITIHVSGYTAAEKVRIARDHLLPEILGEYALSPDDVRFSHRILEDLVGRVEAEEGVRNLRRALEAIVGWLNMQRYLPAEPGGAPVAFPVAVADSHVSGYFAKSSAHTGPGAMRAELLKTMYV